MTKVTLTNSFHNTEVNLNLKPAPAKWGAGFYLVTKSQKQRANRILCGVTDCKCGDTFGARDSKTHLSVQNETYDGEYIVCIEGQI